jgi:hypothetical protein
VKAPRPSARSTSRPFADFIDDPSEMTPESRFGELVSIFAVACTNLLRSHSRPAPDSPLFTENRLDVSRDPTPPLGDGLTPREPMGAAR